MFLHLSDSQPLEAISKNWRNEKKLILNVVAKRNIMTLPRNETRRQVRPVTILTAARYSGLTKPRVTKQELFYILYFIS
jgi:hypothetical protein